jgi:hypothetical protein
MKNDLLHHLLSIGNPEIIMELSDGHNFSIIDFRTINEFLRDLKDKRLEYNGQFYDFQEWMDVFQINKIELNLIEGIQLLQKFKNDQISQIEAFLEMDNDLFIFLKNQFLDMSKKQTMMTYLPKFSNELYLAKKSKKHIILINELIVNSMKLVKDNCTTMNYLNNFITNGLDNKELAIIDAIF